MNNQIKIIIRRIMHPVHYLKNKIALSKYEEGFRGAEKLCLTLEAVGSASLELVDTELINNIKECINLIEAHSYFALINSFISTIKFNKDTIEEEEFKQIEPIIEKWTPVMEKGKFYQGEYSSFLGEVRETPKVFIETLKKIEEMMDKKRSETRIDNIRKRISNALSKIKKAKEIMLSTNFSLMSPYDFEEFIASLFNTLGYKTRVTSKAGDYGVDVVAENASEIVAIQCKRYQEGNNVGNQTVQMLLGAMQLKGLKANRGIVITTSKFTKQAYKQAEDSDVELWDKDILHAKVREHLIDT